MMAYRVPVLAYSRGERDCTADAALRLSWRVVGSVGFGVMTVGVFVLALLLRMPMLLGLLPVWVMVAVWATLMEHDVMRFVGQGALMAGVVLWTGGLLSGWW